MSHADPDPDSLLLAEDLRRAVGGFVRAIRSEAATPRTAQSDALDLLDRDGAMTIAAMALRRGVTHQTMRLIVMQLERAGLVRRTADQADRRSQLCALTEAGRADLRRERDIRSAGIATLIRTRLSPDDIRLLRVSVGLLARLGARSED